jgi:hypothetical protein
VRQLAAFAGQMMNVWQAPKKDLQPDIASGNLGHPDTSSALLEVAAAVNMDEER